MRKKGTLNLLSIIKNLVLAYVKRTSDMMELASLEARLALKTFILLILLSLIVGLLTVSAWVCLLLVIFMALVALHVSSLYASIIIALFNILILILIIVYMAKIKKNLFFPATRRQINSLKHLRKAKS